MAEPLSKTQVQPKGVIKLQHERPRELSEASPDTLHRDRTNLLSLYVGVAGQSGVRSFDKYLKRIDPCHVRRDRRDGDNTTVEAGCRYVSAVIADDHRGTTLTGFRAANRLKIDLSDLAS